jgi:hypothetical protein
MRDLTLYTFAFHLTTASLYMSDIRTTLVTSRHPRTTLKCCMHVRQLSSETIVVSPQRLRYIYTFVLCTPLFYIILDDFFLKKNCLRNMTQVEEIVFDKHSPKFILPTVQHTPVCHLV